MARLAESVIERIKQEISLVRLAESQGHQLKKHGKDYALNCPFHEDRTASLIITQHPICGTAWARVVEVAV